MKKLLCFSLGLILTSCGPKSDDASDTQSTTKTTTTVTTTTPATPAAPMVPAGSLTQANLDRVQNDMSSAEVEAIFGQPSSSQSQPIPIVGGTQTTYTYQSGASAVTIIFKNDQVKQKSGTFGP
jgi:hypothetical protein